MRASALNFNGLSHPGIALCGAQSVMEPHEAILTLTEAAHELRCSKSHLHNISSGKIRDLSPVPVLRLGRRRLIRLDALQAWMRSLEIREIEGQRLTGLFRRA